MSNDVAPRNDTTWKQWFIPALFAVLVGGGTLYLAKIDDGVVKLEQRMTESQQINREEHKDFRREMIRLQKEKAGWNELERMNVIRRTNP